MAVAFRSVGALSSGFGAGSITPALPTGWAENDIFLLFVQSVAGYTAPTDWAEITDSPQTAGDILNIFWRRATASESAPSISGGVSYKIACIAAFSGCATSGDPWDDTAGTGGASGTTATWPAVTTTVADTMIVNVLGWDLDNAGPISSSEANADLTELTERVDGGTITGTGGGIVVITGKRAATGAVASTTATITSTSHSLITIALKPAVAAAGLVLPPPHRSAIPLLIR